MIRAVSELPAGSGIRSALERAVFDKPAVVWRNFEASMDTASLEPRTRAISTYALQEYYYLPYRLHATRDQFSRAYPEAVRFAALKRKADPHNRLRNLLWDRYLGEA
jgi:hypothetical protein